MVAGPSGSGKTVFMQKILQDISLMINPNIDRIVYAYTREQPIFDEMRKSIPIIEFVEGLPDIDDFDRNLNNLLILDDLMQSVDKSIQNLFTIDSHHKNISVFFLTQNLFSQGKFSRTISLNCQYIVLMNNPRDRSQIHFLARQMFPTNSKFLIEVYEYVTLKQSHGYVFLDLKQNTPNDLRVQTGILKGELRIIFKPKIN
jgi:uridine kinase